MAKNDNFSFFFFSNSSYLLLKREIRKTIQIDSYTLTLDAGDWSVSTQASLLIGYETRPTLHQHRARARMFIFRFCPENRHFQAKIRENQRKFAKIIKSVINYTIDAFLERKSSFGFILQVFLFRLWEKWKIGIWVKMEYDKGYVQEDEEHLNEKSRRWHQIQSKRWDFEITYMYCICT